MKTTRYLASLFFCLIFAAAPPAEAVSGDLKHVFSNPLREMEALSECDVWVDFYRVKRPKWTMGVPNNHYYIGVQVYHSYRRAGTERPRRGWQAHAFGLVTSDFQDDWHLHRKLKNKDTKNMWFIGRFKNQEAVRALDMVARESNRYLDKYGRSKLAVFLRFSVTPIAGQSCKRLATHIEDKLRKL